MEMIFNIGKQAPSELGVLEGYIHEGINHVTRVELVLVSRVPLTDDECLSMIECPVAVRFVGLVDAALVSSRYDGKIYELHALNNEDGDAEAFRYQAIIRPRLWDLNYMVRARSFCNMSRVDVAASLLEEWQISKPHGYTAEYKDESVYPKRNQILQNQLSDLTFFQNLLNEAGVNFYFACDRNGENAEVLKLVDQPTGFGVSVKTPIPHNPYSGLLGDYKIDALEKHYRTCPGTALATANLGDGSTRQFQSKKRIENGHAGTYCTFNTEGEEEAVAAAETTRHTEFFQSRRLTFEGHSNHFALRAGERFFVGEKGERLLMTEVLHRFRQTLPSALSQENKIAYENLFFAVNNGTPVRPDNIDNRTLIDLKRRLVQPDIGVYKSNHESEAYSQSTRRDLETGALLDQIDTLKRELNRARDLSGLMVGTVTEDAKVTDRNELICRIENERFKEGLTLKVALSWLTDEGWISFLPRKNSQVYFQFINGSGGRNEAVLVGYRPTGAQKTLDPATSTTTTELKVGAAPVIGEVAKNVVGKSEFSPSNRQRNALKGGAGAAEVAVIDGSDAAVYLHAENRVAIVGDKSVSVVTNSLRESAGSLDQQLGSLNRGVTKNQKVSVGGDLEQYVDKRTSMLSKDYIFIQSLEGDVDVVGKTYVELCNRKFTKLRIEDETISATESGGNHLEVNPDVVTQVAGEASTIVDKKNKVTLKTSGSVVAIEKDSICSAVGTDSAASSMKLDPKGATLSAGTNKVEITKSGNVDVSGSIIAITGDLIKLNC